MRSYRVALAVIARDEAARIGRLLASVAPFVNAMLVLDTGSRDDTAAVAARHGARVEHFAWCDDFAAARNAALEHAAADWHLVLDADEWLIDGGALLHGLRGTPPEFVGALQILDCAVYDEHAEAADALQRADALCRSHPDWRHDLATRLLFSLKKTGRHAQALDWAQTRLDAHAASPDFFFALGDLLLDWAAEQPPLAGELLPMAQQAWQQCLAIGEQPGLSGAVHGRGSWLAAHNLAVVLEGLGQADEAAALRRRHPAPA